MEAPRGRTRRALPSAMVRDWREGRCAGLARAVVVVMIMVSIRGSLVGVLEGVVEGYLEMPAAVQRERSTRMNAWLGGSRFEPLPSIQKEVVEITTLSILEGDWWRLSARKARIRSDFFPSTDPGPDNLNKGYVSRHGDIYISSIK